MKAYFWDVMAAAGLLLLAIGLWLWSPALSLSVTGALLLGAGVLGARAWLLDDLLPPRSWVLVDAGEGYCVADMTGDGGGQGQRPRLSGPGGEKLRAMQGRNRQIRATNGAGRRTAAAGGQELGQVSIPEQPLRSIALAARWPV
jgi:hypothetical protein